MKKTSILLLLLFAWFSGYAQLEGPSAQPQNYNLLSSGLSHNSGFGFKGGVNFANVYGNDKDRGGTTTSSSSFHAGAFAQFSFSEFFSLQPEVIYSRKGFERQDSTFRFDYLEVPVLAVFNITRNVSVHFGPQASLMILSRAEGEELNMDPYNTFDYGIAAGGEVRISRFRLGTRYNVGFADLLKENEAGQSIDDNRHHGVLQVYLGVGF